MLFSYLQTKRQAGPNLELVPFKKKILLAVWLLSNKESHREAANLFGLEKSTVNYIFHEMCNLLSECRYDIIKWPNDNQQRKTINMVMAHYGFPNCIGFIDGCHIQIRAPHNNPVDFYNRKDTHSVVLQAICDHKLQFIDIYVGHTGRAHDARIFRESPTFQRLPNLVSHQRHVLGDSAYPASPYVLTPFKDNGFLSREQIKYNKVHATARSCIERTFGMLKNKFRRLKYLELNKTSQMSVIIAACCVLHNFIINHEMEENEEVDDFYLDMEEMTGAQKKQFICNFVNTI